MTKVSEAGEVMNDELDAEAEARRLVALAQIRQYPDPVLRMKAREVEDFDGDLGRLVERMEQLLHDATGSGSRRRRSASSSASSSSMPTRRRSVIALVNPRLVDGSRSGSATTRAASRSQAS